MVFVHVNMVKENRDPVHILAVSCSCDSEALDRVHMTYCMQIFGCELWNLNVKDIK